MKTVIYQPSKGGVQLPPQLVLSGIGYRVSLKKGSNHLSDDEAAQLLSHDSFKRYAATQALKIIEPESEVVNSGDDKPSDLTGYNVDDAETVIDNEWDKATLEQWRSRDTRKGIFTAIDQRLIQIREGRG